MKYFNKMNITPVRCRVSNINVERAYLSVSTNNLHKHIELLDRSSDVSEQKAQLSERSEFCAFCDAFYI